MAPNDQDIPIIDESAIHPTKRYIYMGIGFFFVGLAAVGVVLPVLPTTPFLIVAAWAFSKSSQRFHTWLYTHRIYGPYIIAWNEHRVIPRFAKILAIVFMAMGWAIFTFTIATTWLWPTVIGVGEICVAIYILSKPSAPPGED